MKRYFTNSLLVLLVLLCDFEHKPLLKQNLVKRFCIFISGFLIEKFYGMSASILEYKGV